MKRGNVFRYRFGMDLLPFSNYAEEARFWRMMQMLEEVRNPADGLFYTWTRDQAIQGLQAGIIDAFLESSGGPGMQPDDTRLGGYKVTDPTAGAQLRTKCLAALRGETQLI